MTPEQIKKIKIIKNIYVPSDNLQAILDKLKSIRELSVIDEYEHLPDCMMITGETGVGKTSFIRQYMKRNLRVDESYEEGERTIVPVLYCELPKAKHPRPVAAELLRELGDELKGTKGDTNDLLSRLVVQLKASKVELIIIDEFQHAIETTNKEVIKEIGELFKRLINRTNIPIAFFGMPWSSPIFEVNNQLKRRVRKNKFKLENYTLETFEEFQMFLQIVEEELPIDTESSLWEVDTAFKLFAASSGNLSELMDGIIMPAAIEAVKDGSEFVKDEHLIEAAEENLDFLEELNPLSMDHDKVEAKQQANESYWNSEAPKNSLRVVDATYAKVKFSDLKLKTYLKKR